MRFCGQPEGASLARRTYPSALCGLERRRAKIGNELRAHGPGPQHTRQRSPFFTARAADFFALRRGVVSELAASSVAFFRRAFATARMAGPVLPVSRSILPGEDSFFTSRFNSAIGFLPQGARFVGFFACGFPELCRGGRAVEFFLAGGMMSLTRRQTACVAPHGQFAGPIKLFQRISQSNIESAKRVICLEAGRCHNLTDGRWRRSTVTWRLSIPVCRRMRHRHPLRTDIRGVVNADQALRLSCHSGEGLR